MVLVLSVIGLTTMGLVMVLSASSVSSFAANGSSFTYFNRQLLHAVAGSLLALGASRLPYRVWRRAWAPLALGTLVLLVLVLTPLGTTAGGASRWLHVGALSVQPSEPAKLIVVAGVAAILSGHVRTLERSYRWAAPVGLLFGVVALLILLQPDLGTASIIAVTVFVMLFVAGVRLTVLAGTAFGSAVMGVALILGADYRRARLFSFFDPWSDPQNTGYHVVQSLIALGSGHVFGVGLGASRQKWLYVPNSHTDFLFSIMGEELGLVGEAAVLALFGALVYAGVRISLQAPDPFGRLLAVGITAWLGFQALVNLGAVTGVLPITGVPLPFMSFGGSALVVSLVAVGILVSIGRGPAPALSGGRRTAR